MDAMEDKLGAILGNPELMQQIMTMAQSLGGAGDQPAPPPPLVSDGIDPAMVQKLLGLARQSGIDGNQQALLRALQPFLGEEKLRKLEKAMRSAKLAGLASSALGSGLLRQLMGG